MCSLPFSFICFSSAKTSPSFHKLFSVFSLSFSLPPPPRAIFPPLGDLGKEGREEAPSTLWFQTLSPSPVLFIARPFPFPQNVEKERGKEMLSVMFLHFLPSLLFFAKIPPPTLTFPYRKKETKRAGSFSFPRRKHGTENLFFASCPTPQFGALIKREGKSFRRVAAEEKKG